MSGLIADLPRMVSTPEIRVDCPEELKFQVAEGAKELFGEFETNALDGVRVTFDKGWGLVRASNTQPVLVMRFEAESEQLLDEYRQIVESRIAELRDCLEKRVSRCLNWLMSSRSIEIVGANANNLKSISCSLPLGGLLVVCGPSGSGKSSLLFDTIDREAKRRYFRNLIPERKHTVLRPDVEDIRGLSFAVGLKPLPASSPWPTLASISDVFDPLKQLFFHLGERRCINDQTPLKPESREDILESTIELGGGGLVAVSSTRC